MTKKVLELSELEWSFDFIKWKPVIFGRDFGSVEVSFYLRARDQKLFRIGGKNMHGFISEKYGEEMPEVQVRYLKFTSTGIEIHSDD